MRRLIRGCVVAQFTNAGDQRPPLTKKCCVNKGTILITDKTMFLAGLAGFDLGYELSPFKNSLYQVRGNKEQLDCFAEQLLREIMPDKWFPDSKDWQYSVWERAEIMKSKIESYKEEIERLESWLKAKHGD